MVLKLIKTRDLCHLMGWCSLKGIYVKEEEEEPHVFLGAGL
jgi:hypothetical protein